MNVRSQDALKLLVGILSYCTFDRIDSHYLQVANRDGTRCPITKLPIRTTAVFQAGTLPSECAHILPFSIHNKVEASCQYFIMPVLTLMVNVDKCTHRVGDVRAKLGSIRHDHFQDQPPIQCYQHGNLRSYRIRLPSVGN
jgi:hypothetical protein